MVPIFSISASGIERKCEGCGKPIPPDAWHFFVRIPLGERSYSVILEGTCMNEWQVRTGLAIQEFNEREARDKERR